MCKLCYSFWGFFSFFANLNFYSNQDTNHKKVLHRLFLKFYTCYSFFGSMSLMCQIPQTNKAHVMSECNRSSHLSISQLLANALFFGNETFKEGPTIKCSAAIRAKYSGNKITLWTSSLDFGLNLRIRPKKTD